MEVMKNMKGRKKIFISILISAIVICSIFVLAIESNFLGATTAEGKKPSLLVKIFINERSGTIPFEVNFSSLVLYHTGNLKYEWDFGDNETSSEIHPIHTYNQTGFYECSLTVTDSSGKNITDKVEIIVRDNEAPIVSITLSDLKPNRPFIPILRRRFISISYYGRNFRRIIDHRFFPKSLLNMGGFVTCEATAISPEGNEIESYKWKLSPPTYNKLTGSQEKPEYIFEGKNVTIPLLYTYPEAPYDLTVIVTDSEGFIGTSTIKFETQLHSLESQMQSIKFGFDSLKQNLWHNTLKFAFGEPLGEIIYEDIFPIFSGVPGLKSILILRLFLNWGLSPEISDVTNVSAKFLEKHKIARNIVLRVFNSLIKHLNNRKQKSPNLENLLDKIIDSLERLLESIGLQNKRPVLSEETPKDGTEHLSINYPEVAITVNDSEGDPFDITIHGRYVNNLTLLNQKNDTFIATLKTPLPNLTEIKWNVNVSYAQNRWINETYTFSTW